MYSSYKPPSLSKTGAKKKSKNVASASTDKVRVKPKPEWNDAITTENPYKLSASELVQKKISLMSKHRLEAKEEWNERQEKLRRGVVDDETKRIYDTARQSKNLSIRDDEVQRKNLSQMLNYIPKPQSSASSKNLSSEDVKANLTETRKFIQKVEQYSKEDDPNRLLHIMNKLQQQQLPSNSTTIPNVSSAHSTSTARTNAHFKSTNSHQSNNNNLRTAGSPSTNRGITLESEQIRGNHRMESLDSQQQQPAGMNNYFSSLDKIEETIKFMEEKILCERKKPEMTNPTAPLSTASDVANPTLQNQQRTDQQQQQPKHFSAYQITAQNNHSMNAQQQQQQQRKDSSSLIMDQSRNQRTRGLGDSDAISFNLTEGDDDFNPSRMMGNTNNSGNNFKTANNMRVLDEDYDSNNDVKVNDFDIQPLDPNMFFMDAFNDGDDNEESIVAPPQRAGVTSSNQGYSLPATGKENIKSNNQQQQHQQSIEFQNEMLSNANSKYAGIEKKNATHSYEYENEEEEAFEQLYQREQLKKKAQSNTATSYSGQMNPRGNFAGNNSSDYGFGSSLTQPQQLQHEFEEPRRNNYPSAAAAAVSSQDKYVSNLNRKPLQQQQCDEDEYDTGFFARPQSAYVQQVKTTAQNDRQNMSSKQWETTGERGGSSGYTKMVGNHNSKQNQANDDDDDEEDDDCLSRMNIDSIKEMLEATKRDLERLDEKPVEIVGDSRFHNPQLNSQYTTTSSALTSSQLPNQNGKRMLETVKVVSNVGLSRVPPAQSDVNRGTRDTSNKNNEYLSNDYFNNLSDEKYQGSAEKKQITQNRRVDQNPSNNNASSSSQSFNHNNFIGAGTPSSMRFAEQQKSLEEQPMFMSNNLFQTRTDNPFTSNIFMASASTSSANTASDLRRPTTTNSYADSQNNQQSLETFKKTLKTYTRNPDSMNIHSHLQ